MLGFLVGKRNGINIAALNNVHQLKIDGLCLFYCLWVLLCKSPICFPLWVNASVRLCAVSDVDIVAVLLALGDPVTEVTSTDTIINATLTQDDPPVPPWSSSHPSHPGHHSPTCTWQFPPRIKWMRGKRDETLSQADMARMLVIFLLILDQNLQLTMKN